MHGPVVFPGYLEIFCGAAISVVSSSPWDGLTEETNSSHVALLAIVAGSASGSVGWVTACQSTALHSCVPDEEAPVDKMKARGD